MATPLVIGGGVGAAALGCRYMLKWWQSFLTQPRVRRFYPGGFQQVMNRREAALILGVGENAVVDKVREAHRRVMVANHPDAGGSHYLASKVNEAKEILLGKSKGATSAF